MWYTESFFPTRAAHWGQASKYTILWLYDYDAFYDNAETHGFQTAPCVYCPVL